MQKIATRLIGGTVVIVMIALMAYAFTVAMVMTSELDNKNLAYLEEVNGRVAGEIKAEFLPVENMVHNYAAILTMKTRAVHDQESMLAMLEDTVTITSILAESNEEVLGLYLEIDPSVYGEYVGIGYGRDPSEAKGVTEVNDMDNDDFYPDNPDMDWFYDTMQSQAANWTSPYIDAQLGVNMISYVQPFYMNGNLIGVVGADLNVEALIDKISAMAIGRTGDVVIIDEDNVFLVNKELPPGAVTVEDTGNQALLNFITNPAVQTTEMDFNNRTRILHKSHDGDFTIITRIDKAEVGESISRIYTYGSIAIIASVIISAAIAVVNSWTVISPVKTATRHIQELADGNFSDPIPTPPFKDEIREMSASLERMRVDVSSLLREASDKTELAVGMTAAINENIEVNIDGVKDTEVLAHKTNDVVTTILESIGETNTAIDEIAKGVEIVANNTNNITESSNNIVGRIENSQGTVDSTLDTFDSIENVSQLAMNNVNDLIERLANVEDFVETITNISEQTNLLALNASIEAARAGEAGRGFAVVADEVRKLAEESRQASEEVANIVVDIMGSGQLVSDTTAENQETVVQGKAAVTNVAQDFAQIREEMLEIAKYIQELSALTQEMSASTEEVSASMQNIVVEARVIPDSMQDLIDNVDHRLALSQEMKENSDRITDAVISVRDTACQFTTDCATNIKNEN